MAFIYKITNDINQKVYIGMTERTIEERFKEHCKNYKYEQCEKRPLYVAMKKYGIEHFHVELVEETDNPEEREQYWIKFYNSYGNGYNATIRGDGRSFIDNSQVIKTYLQTQNLKETAALLGYHYRTISKVLKRNNIMIPTNQETNRNKHLKCLNAYDKNSKKFIISFETYMDAAKWLIENNLTNCKLTTIRTHISEAARGKRKTAAGFIWKLKE